MRSLLLTCAVVCLALVASVATAAPGQVPDATLAAFGLSGVQQLTDAQGTQIHGMGFAVVGGLEVATGQHGTVAANGYLAAGNHVAAGAAISVVAGHGGSVAFGGAVAVTGR